MGKEDIVIDRDRSKIPDMMKLSDLVDWLIVASVTDYSGVCFSGFGIETCDKGFFCKFEDVTGYIKCLLDGEKTLREVLESWKKQTGDDYIPKETSTLRVMGICGYVEEETNYWTDCETFEMLVEVPKIPIETILMGAGIAVATGALIYGATRRAR